jgi:hypothetical protein
MPIAPLARLTREIDLVITAEKKRRGVDWPVTFVVVERQGFYEIAININVPAAVVEERD